MANGKEGAKSEHHSTHRKGPSAIVIKSGQGAATTGKRVAAKKKEAESSDKESKSNTANAASSARAKLPGGEAAKPTPKKTKEKKAEKKKDTRKSKAPQINPYLAFFGIGHDIILRDPTAIEAAQALDLQQWHLRKLRIKFQEIDIDGSGTIDADEFFSSVGENRTPFTDKLFALIDLDGNGTIEFEEYVRVMATYCMFSKDEILKFCFECFDVDGSGTIDEKEFVELCKVVNNAAPMFPNNFKRALGEFDVNEDGLIDYGEFCEIDRRYPLVLFPAFRLQDMMQRGSLGEMQWVKVIEGYNQTRLIEEYKAAHGGKLPPDPFLTRMGKTFFPCFYRERVHIKMGKDLDDKHRRG